MWEWFTKLKPEDQIKVIALVGAAVAFVVGLMQYRKAQRWKRSEWVAKEMDAFFADRQVSLALQMLDWINRPIELYPERDDQKSRFVTVTDDMLARALESHKNRREGFNLVEVTLRDVFDHFLDRLERINSFVDAHLISVKDIRPYLDYWAKRVMMARSDQQEVQRFVQLRKFMRDYDFVGVEQLFVRLAKPRMSERLKRNVKFPIERISLS